MSSKYYESQQKILDRMLSRISGLSTIEGSTTYMQHSPIAIELENIKLSSWMKFKQSKWNRHTPLEDVKQL